MSDRSNSEQSKTVVDAYYQAGVEGRLWDFAQYLDPDFATTAPNYLPWGGFHPGAGFFRVKFVRVRLLLSPLNWCIGRAQWRILARSGGTNEGLLSRRR